MLLNYCYYSEISKMCLTIILNCQICYGSGAKGSITTYMW